MTESFWQKYDPSFTLRGDRIMAEESVPPVLLPLVRKRNHLIDAGYTLCSTCGGFGTLFFTNNPLMGWKCMECRGDGCSRKG